MRSICSGVVVWVMIGNVASSSHLQCSWLLFLFYVASGVCVFGVFFNYFYCCLFLFWTVIRLSAVAFHVNQYKRCPLENRRCRVTYVDVDMYV